MAAPEIRDRTFPLSAGILFGLGLGGFFDGIVLHQVLQWHHMLSSWYPIDSLANLELNTRWDGYFHSATYVFVVLGLFFLWRTAHLKHLVWSNRLILGTLLLGWGAFNLIEGLVDHEILGVHHVMERASGARRASAAEPCATGSATGRVPHPSRFDRPGAPFI